MDGGMFSDNGDLVQHVIDGVVGEIVECLYKELRKLLEKNGTN